MWAALHDTTRLSLLQFTQYTIITHKINLFIKNRFFYKQSFPYLAMDELLPGPLDELQMQDNGLQMHDDDDPDKYEED